MIRFNAIRWRRCFAVFAVIFCGLIVAGCGRRTTPAAELNAGIAPFTHTRDQTIALVATQKHALGAEDLNSLAIAYTALEGRANAYADFLVESVSVTSFDKGRNDQCALNLTKAISAFNKSYAALVSPKQPAAPVESTWIPTFADSIRTYWTKYNTAIATMSPQTKSDLVKQLKSETVWPNYENIATESVTSPPH